MNVYQVCGEVRSDLSNILDVYYNQKKQTLINYQYDPSENEISEQLGIKQSVVNQHSTTFGWNAVEQLLKYYEQMEF